MKADEASPLPCEGIEEWLEDVRLVFKAAKKSDGAAVRPGEGEPQKMLYDLRTRMAARGVANGAQPLAHVAAESRFIVHQIIRCSRLNAIHGKNAGELLADALATKVAPAFAGDQQRV